MLSTVFARLSFLCACLVVCLHGDMLDQTGTVAHVVQEAIRALYRCALPLFFFMSGYWFVGHVDEEGWWRRALRKRIRTLGVPYVVFILLSLLFYVFRDVVLAQVPLLGGATGVLRHLGFDLRHPTGDNMWYLRCLFLFFLVTPLVLPLVRRSACATGGLAVASALVPLVTPKSSEGIFWYFGFNAYGFALFLLGMRLRWTNLACATRLQTVAGRTAGLVAGWCGLVGAVACPNVFAVAFVWQPLMFAGLLAVAAVLPIPKAWGAYSFPIYALHWFFLATVTVALRAHVGVFNSFFANGILVVAAVLFAIGVAKALKAGTPRVHQLVFGNR